MERERSPEPIRKMPAVRTKPALIQGRIVPLRSKALPASSLAESRERLAQPLAIVLHAADLDLLVAAHEVGQVGERHRGVEVVGGELRERAVDRADVLAGQLALEPTHLGV